MESAWYFTASLCGGAFKWPLGTVLLCPPATSHTSVSLRPMGVLYNLSKPQGCISAHLIKFAKYIHSTVPGTQ